MFTDISKFCTSHSVAWVLSCATHTQHARNMACCAATQRCNLRCFALFPRIFGTASLLNGVLPFLRPVSGRSAKHCNLQRCVAAAWPRNTPCCVHVAYVLRVTKHTQAANSGQASTSFKITSKTATVGVTDSQKTVRRKASETLTTRSAGRETSKASPSTQCRPTPDREAFNHKTLRFQIQPARHPQMRPQHHVQPLTNPPGHAQEPHETTDNNKTCCSNPPTACNRNYTRRRTETK